MLVGWGRGPLMGGMRFLRGDGVVEDGVRCVSR